MKLNITTRIITVLSVTVILLCACKGEKKQNAPKQETTGELAFDPASLGEEPELVISTTMGDITVKLFKDTPAHRDNFLRLASEHFYDSLLFHRIIEDFMMQGGDPTSKNAPHNVKLGSGDVGYRIPAEIKEEHSHVFGSLAAARDNNPEKASSGCQFYIVNNKNGYHGLDGNYTVFGQLTEGERVVRKIGKVKTDMRDRPIEDVMILSIRPK